jgi:hypothetical protein
MDKTSSINEQNWPISNLTVATPKRILFGSLKLGIITRSSYLFRTSASVTNFCDACSFIYSCGSLSSNIFRENIYSESSSDPDITARYLLSALSISSC